MPRFLTCPPLPSNSPAQIHSLVQRGQMSAGSVSEMTSMSDDMVSRMIPPFLPDGKIVAWDMTRVPNPLTKKIEFTFTVSVQTAGMFHGSACSPSTTDAFGEPLCDVQCDGPCGSRLPASQLIQMGKCEHLLCKACYGVVKNPDGSYGCSNFQCWREPDESSRACKRHYRKVIQKQMERARKLKEADVVGQTNGGGGAVVLGARGSGRAVLDAPESYSLATTPSCSSIDSCGLIKPKKMRLMP